MHMTILGWDAFDTNPISCSLNCISYPNSDTIRNVPNPTAGAQMTARAGQRVHTRLYERTWPGEDWNSQSILNLPVQTISHTASLVINWPTYRRCILYERTGNPPSCLHSTFCHRYHQFLLLMTLHSVTVVSRAGPGSTNITTTSS